MWLLKKVLTDIAQIEQFAGLCNPIECSFLEIDFAYPLQMNDLAECISDLHNYYATYNVFHCGRGGSFDYCNSDQAYKQGKELVQRLLQGIKI